MIPASLAAVGHHLERVLRTSRWWLNPAARKWYRAFLAKTPAKPTGTRRVVVFDFKDSRIDGPQGRRFYTLFIFFVRAGFEPAFSRSFLFLATLPRTIKRYCLDESISVVEPGIALPAGSVLVTDRETPRFRDGDFAKTITVDFRPGYADDREGFPMPFPMFPLMYVHRTDLSVEELRTSPRRWQVFFGGDILATKYSKSSTPTIYGKLPRGDVLDTLRQHLPPDQWHEPRSKAELSEMLAQQMSGVVVVNVREVGIPTENWLQTMASASFFLACPGVRYPMSHNLIEALSVGTVPITEYPELMFPPLEDGVNCIAYRGAAGVREAVDRTLAMSPAEAQRLSAGASAYYDQYLRPDAAIRRLLDHPGKRVRLRLLPFLKLGGGYA